MQHKWSDCGAPGNSDSGVAEFICINCRRLWVFDYSKKGNTFEKSMKRQNIPKECARIVAGQD